MEEIMAELRLSCVTLLNERVVHVRRSILLLLKRGEAPYLIV